MDAADATAEVGKHEGARGVDRGPAVGLVAFGAGLVPFSAYAGGRPHRAARCFGEAQPPPEDFRVESRLRALTAAMYPSTIGLTVLTVIALWPQPPLAAFLAGILAGLGVMALVGLTRLSSWERGRRSRFFVEPKSEQVFEAPR